MYIKLGKTNINYLNGDTENSYMIVSDIVDSTLSYESPVLVRTKEELDIWFSKNFSERNFLISLLENNITLYLYKPIDTLDSLGDNDKDYINFDEVTFNLPVTTNLLDKLEDWKIGNFKLLNNNTLTKAEPSEVKNISYKDGLYINDSTNQVIGDVLEVNGSGSVINLNYGEIQKGDTTGWFKIYNSSKKLIKLVVNFNSESETVILYGGNSSKICIKYQNDKAKPTLIGANNYKDTIEVDCSKSHIFTTRNTGVYYNNLGVDFSKLIVTQSRKGNVDIELSSVNINNELFIYCDKSVGSDFRLKLENSQGWYNYASLEKREVWYRVDIKNKYNFVITELNDYPGASYYILGGNSEFSITTESAFPTWEGFSINNDEDLETLKKIKTENDIKIECEGKYYYWEDNRLVPEDELVQNSLNKSGSLDNRSTLGITTAAFSNLVGVNYYYPEYREYNEEHLGVYSEVPNVELKLSSYSNGNFIFDSKKFFEKNLQSYIIDIIIDVFNSNSSGFLTLKLDETLYFFTYNYDLEKSEFYQGLNNYKIININSSTTKEIFIDNLKKSIESFQELKENLELIIKDNKLTIVSKSDPLFINNFYEFEGLTMKADFNKSKLLLANYIQSGNKKVGIINCEFYSKIIGTYDELVEDNGDIKVVIEDITESGNKLTLYRITISRFDYVEVFEGYIFPIPGVSTRLDYIISKNSKLVYCNFKNIDSGLSLGTYTLKNINNISETINSGSWMKSLDLMLGNQRTFEVYPDFFLIENLRNYTNENSIKDTSYYKEYEIFLEYAKDLNLQFLIQNSESRYKYYLVSDFPETFKKYENSYYQRIKSFRVYESEELNEDYYNYYEVDALPTEFEEDEYSVYYIPEHFVITENGVVNKNSFKFYNEDSLPKKFKIENSIYKINNSYYVVKDGVLSKDLYYFAKVDELPEKIDTTINNIYLIKEKYYVVNDSKISEGDYTFKEVDELPNVFEENTIYNVKEKIIKISNGAKVNDSVSLRDLTEAYIGNDYIFNYKSDLDNRLVYFYDCIFTNGTMYPGYSLFLLNIIKGDYELSCNNINYDAPGGITTYDNSPLEEKLDTYKSNYLTFNNHLYYYNKYQNGEYFNTTIFLRFILGKIVRELEKNKGSYIGEKYYRSSYNAISDILVNIEKYFKIVDTIEITNYEFTPETNSLSLEMNTKVNDLVDNNITLNITLNFNK